ncbi:MAG: NADH-quinone oxidoreductase subunit C [Candidatus Omnitrophica bacterium]|nr:NADH-quinone oxidoreductase subunit C [Candidatus Omnitrophota bacterium]
MNLQEIQSKIEAALPGIRLKPVRESLLIEDAAMLPKVAAFLKNDPVLALDYLSSVTGADYLKYLESVYHLYSVEKKTGPVVLRVRVTRDSPRIPSLVPIYRGAEFQEREAFDMYGLYFENHPDLRRIFMWEGFEGFPMRKDYEQEDSEILETADIEWLDRHGAKVPEGMRKKAADLKAQGKRAVAEKTGKSIE